MQVTAQAQLKGFLAKYTPEMAAKATSIVAEMMRILPGSVRMVYDNYNALVVGFGPSEKVSEAIFSIAVYPRWVTLFFLRGARMYDPAGVLKGKGSVVRHVVLAGPEDLTRPDIAELMEQALDLAKRPIDPEAGEKLVIKSVSAKQRARRPG